MATFHVSGYCLKKLAFFYSLYHYMTAMSSLIVNVVGNRIVNNRIIADKLILSY